MIGNLDDIFSGRKSFILNDDYEEDGDIVLPQSKVKKTKTKKLKGEKVDIKQKCKEQMMTGKGNLKIKLTKDKSAITETMKKRYADGVPQQRNKKNEMLIKKNSKVNISDKLKSISSKVRPIDINNKVKKEKLSAVKNNCPNYTDTIKDKKPQLMNKINQIASSTTMDDCKSDILIPSVDTDSYSEEDNTPLLDNNVSEDDNNKESNVPKQKRKIKPSRIINRFITSNKCNYAHGLNRILQGIDGKKFTKKYSEQEKRKITKKAKKFLKAHARKEHKTTKKMKKEGYYLKKIKK